MAKIMSGECETCGEHCLDCKCNLKKTIKWISIGDYLINPEFFKIFYIENTPDEKWVIFAEDKSDICWKLNSYHLKETADIYLNHIYKQIQD